MSLESTTGGDLSQQLASAKVREKEAKEKSAEAQRDAEKAETKSLAAQEKLTTARARVATAEAKVSKAKSNPTKKDKDELKNAKRALALAEAKATDAAENHLKLSVASKKAAKMAETASKDVLHLEELSAAAKVTIALANANLASAKASAAAAEAVVAVSENKVLEAHVQATGEATAIKPNVKRPAKVKPVPLPIIVNPWIFRASVNRPKTWSISRTLSSSGSELPPDIITIEGIQRTSWELCI